MHIVLFEPEIPPNTGNIARLCAGFKIALHLIEPLGFKLEDRYLKRAGLDYWPAVQLSIWPDFATYRQNVQGRLIASSARGGSLPHSFDFLPNDALLFGPETRGLPPDILALADHTLRIPITDDIRSLNLSTAVGIIAYQALGHTGLLPL